MISPRPFSANCDVIDQAARVWGAREHDAQLAILFDDEADRELRAFPLGDDANRRGVQPNRFFLPADSKRPALARRDRPS